MAGRRTEKRTVRTALAKARPLRARAKDPGSPPEMPLRQALVLLFGVSFDNTLGKAASAP